ncbi:MAG: glutamate ligase domain-containing protein, partial [Chitinophagales bacterium]
ENVQDNITVAGNKTQYGFKYGDIQATNVQVFPTQSIFTINSGTTTFKLNYNGRHNIENVLAAVSVGKTLGLSEEAMSSAIATFKGIKRRFELIYQDEKITFIDDYAHHPTEIEALLKSVREIYPSQRVLSIFQPHLFSRTKDLADDFAAALDLSDEIILLPIYPARELPLEGITSDWLSKKLHKPVSVVEKTDVLSVLKARPCTIILTIGAGDISTLIPEIKKQYRDPS